MAGLFGGSRRGGPIGLFGRACGAIEEEQRRLADLALLAGRLGGSLQSHHLHGIPPREPLAENLVPMAQLPVLHRVPLPGGGGLPFEPPSSGSPFPLGFAADLRALGLPGAAGGGPARPPIGGFRAEAEGYAGQTAQRGTPRWGSAVRDFVMQGSHGSGDDGFLGDEGPTGSGYLGEAEEDSPAFGIEPGLFQSSGFGPENEAGSVRPAALSWEGEASPTQFMRPVAFQRSFERAQDRAIAQEQARRTGQDAGEIYGTLRGFPNQEPQERVSPVPVRPTQAPPAAGLRLLEPNEQAPGQRLQASAMPGSDLRRDPTPRELVKSRIRVAESTNDDRAVNSESTAMGRYQFTDDNWAELHREIYGGDGLADKFNIGKQERIMDARLDRYEATLRRYKFEPTSRNLYLVHFAGPTGALRLLRNPDKPVEALLSRDAIRANKEVLQGKTAAEVIAWADRKMNGAPPRGRPSRSPARAPVPRK